MKFTINDKNEILSLEEIKKLAPEFYDQIILIAKAENEIHPDALINDVRKIYQEFVNYKNKSKILLLPEFEKNLKDIEENTKCYEYNKNNKKSSEYIIPVDAPFKKENSIETKVNKVLLKPETNSEEVVKNYEEDSSPTGVFSEKSTQQVIKQSAPDSPTSKAYSSLKKSSEIIIAAVINVVQGSNENTEKSLVASLSICMYGIGGASSNSDSENDDFNEESVLMGQNNNNLENGLGFPAKAEG